MPKFQSSTVIKDDSVTQQVVLPMYTLDSPLVLLPGLVYSVTFSRFKAAALLSRFRRQVETIPVAKALLAEFDFDSAVGDATGVSEEALDGIKQFRGVENKVKSGLPSLSQKLESLSGFDSLVVCISPNLDKISNPQKSLDALQLGIFTVSRVIGIVDDTTTVKVTFQALRRASKVAGAETVRANEVAVSVVWNEALVEASKHYEEIWSVSKSLFSLIDRFVDEYRQVLNSQDKKQDLLTLNPLANALFLQLAGSKDFAKAYSSLKKIVRSMTLADVRDPQTFLRVVDLLVAIVPFPNHEKLKVLSALGLEKRVEIVKSMLRKMNEVFQTIRENNSMVNHWFYEEASNIQRANVVANQLKSIRVVLEGLSKNSYEKQALVKPKNGLTGSRRRGNDGKGVNGEDDEDDDDMRAISEFIKQRLPEITSISDDSKRLIVKDYKRIKSSTPGNADFHVIRNYLEIVSDLPWDKFVSKFQSNKDIDVSVAKQQLDEDHYGLENVKTRLLQYLVVLKLLASNAEDEYKQLKIEEAEKEKKMQEEKERLKFTRESSSGETFIIPNDEARNSKEANSTKEASASQTKSLLASKNNKSPIIMLAGPPGVGKTSLAKSVARVLGRKFQRISLGGVKDESEIRGHRRTYVGAMPGTIVQALRKALCMNPVILLDEIDKVVGGGSNMTKFNGDPAAALLEVLDPEQNTQFIDHYLGFPIDLSQVIFICTANEPYNLSRPLLDRLEMIEIGAYDYGEKLIIGSKYLLPRQIKRNGFPDGATVSIDENVMKQVIIDYTREAGVRNFERKLGTICRFKAVEYSESLANSDVHYDPKVEIYDLAKYLGVPHSNSNSAIIDVPILSSKYGVVNGLSYNADGSGSVLIFECVGIAGEKNGPTLKMTGRLGDVLMESAKIGLTFIKSLLYRRLFNTADVESLIDRLGHLEIHLHVPSGAIQKDGPSAGITMALAFLSLLMEKAVPLDIAMTGEITLRGLVLPIGGLKEKFLGAHLTGHVNRIIVPRDNRRDVLEEYVQKINDTLKLNALLKDDSQANFKNTAPEDYFAEKYGVQILYAKEFWDVVKHVWGEDLLMKSEETRLSEYHL